MRTRFARAVIAIAKILLQARRKRHDARILRNLSDWQLRDIGMTRSDIWRVDQSILRSPAD